MTSPWSESRMREIRTSGLMSGEWKRSGSLAATAPLLDSTTLAAHLANHLAASGFVLPHHITLDMPWSSSPPGDQSITQSEPPECEISGLALRVERISQGISKKIQREESHRHGRRGKDDQPPADEDRIERRRSVG